MSTTEALIPPVLTEGQKAWDNFKADNSKYWKTFNGCVAALSLLMCIMIIMVLKNEATPDECSKQPKILKAVLVVHLINIFFTVLNIIGKDELDVVYHPIAVILIVLFEFSVFVALHFIHFGVLG